MESVIAHYMLFSNCLLLKHNTPPGLGVPITINNETTIAIHNLRTI